jgi:putative membrane protein
MIMPKTFFKGLAMGICDTIPGISSGTIAFITGIYHRLIEAIKSFSPKIIIDSINYSFKKDGENLKSLKQDIKKLDLIFLTTLVFGIILGIFISSRILKILLDNYLPYTLSFFIGLILASSLIIFKEIKNHKIINQIFALIGLLIGVLISFIAPASTDSPSSIYLLLGGFLGASAMFLPGISGAFILLVMGIYEFIINAVQNIRDNLFDLTVFGIGFLLGMGLISRIISFIFKKDKCKTLYFLLGLVLGSLIVPLKEINSYINFMNYQDTIILALLFFIGILTILIVWTIERKSKDKIIEVPK